ncbi:MAG TPA: trigger factor, partial [Gemmataceae bacterium]|nr:trigger factor [Gemmataceae bacterium]
MADENLSESTDPETTATAEAEAPEEGEEKVEKLVQQVEMRDIGPCKKHIKVTVDRTSIEGKLEKKFSELRKDASVRGFRPGKVPRKIIEKHFHKDVFDQVKAEVMLQSLEQLAEENNVAPLSAPDINPLAIEIPKEGPLVYEFDVEVRPDFDLPNYTGLKLRRPVKEFTDADVEMEEKRLLAPYGQLVPKTDGAAEVGDFITADITTRAADRVISELKETQIRIEPRLVFKDAVADRFGEQVGGAKPGDKREVDLTMSERVADASLRGKTVKASFDIKDLKMLRMPELTHELLHEFGVHSEEQL